jgi:hypothetical protein
MYLKSGDIHDEHQYDVRYTSYSRFIDLVPRSVLNELVSSSNTGCQWTAMQR